ncbi:MAG: UPF0158 family protein [Sphaerochaeta sp.]
MSTYHFPPLTEHLIEEIAFAMEDQNWEHFLDLKEGVIITDKELRALEDDEEKAFDNERYASIPEWTSADGFRLMERFADGVRNIPVKENLFAALNRGKGVFRAFKDALGAEATLEQKWYLFKDQELRNVVIHWYEAEAGAAELETLPPEDEELFEEILLEDFTFEACDEFNRDEILDFADTILQHIGKANGLRTVLTQSFEGKQKLLTHLARTASGELAGLIAYTLYPDESTEILLYGIDDRYQGLGLFRLLFDSFSRQLGRLRVHRIFFGVTEEAQKLKELFIRHGAKPIMSIYELSTDDWNSNHANSESAFV